MASKTKQRVLTLLVGSFSDCVEWFWWATSDLLRDCRGVFAGRLATFHVLASLVVFFVVLVAGFPLLVNGSTTQETCHNLATQGRTIGEENEKVPPTGQRLTNGGGQIQIEAWSLAIVTGTP